MLRIFCAVALITALPSIAVARADRHHHANHDTRGIKELRHQSVSKTNAPRATTLSEAPLIAEAQRWIGATAAELGVRHSLWCAAALNKWLHNIGRPGTGSDAARSFLRYGHRIAEPEVGAIAVFGRGRGGHVGVVAGIAPNGDPIVISGNHGHRVAKAIYPRRRVLAYVGV
jgi:uncharacterized protein (TIGR02594 family)